MVGRAVAARLRGARGRGRRGEPLRDDGADAIVLDAAGPAAARVARRGRGPRRQRDWGPPRAIRTTRPRVPATGGARERGLPASPCRGGGPTGSAGRPHLDRRGVRAGWRPRRPTSATAVSPTEPYGSARRSAKRSRSRSSTSVARSSDPAPGRPTGLWEWLVDAAARARGSGFTSTRWTGVTSRQLAVLCGDLVEPRRLRAGPVPPADASLRPERADHEVRASLLPA